MKEDLDGRQSTLSQVRTADNKTLNIVEEVVATSGFALGTVIGLVSGNQIVVDVNGIGPRLCNKYVSVDVGESDRVLVSFAETMPAVVGRRDPAADLGGGGGGGVVYPQPPIPQFFLAIPSTAVVMQLAPAPDNGFWLVAYISPPQTWPLGSVIESGTKTLLIRYDERGEYKAHASFLGVGAPPVLSCDEESNLYVAIETGGSAIMSTTLQDKRGAFRTISSNSVQISDTLQWVCRLNADGTWAWVKRYRTWKARTLKVHSGNVYFHHVARGYSGQFDEGENLTVVYGEDKGHVISRLNATTGAFINCVYSVSAASSTYGQPSHDMRLEVTYNGFPVTLFINGQYSLNESETYAGIAINAKHTFAVFHDKDLTALNWMRMSNDNTQFKVRSFVHDAYGNACWFLGEVLGGGVKMGEPHDEQTVPYSGTGTDLLTIRTSPTLGGAPSIKATLPDMPGVDPYLVLLQPGKPAIFLQGPDVVPATGSTGGSVLLPATGAEGGLLAYETVSYFLVEGYEGTTIIWPFSRAFGGAIAYLNSGATSGEILFEPVGNFEQDPAEFIAPGQYAIASLDPEGTWWGGSAVTTLVFLD